MKKVDLEKSRDLIKKVNILIRNSEISSLISDNIYHYANDRQSKIEVDENSFKATNKKIDGDFKVVFSPSIENCSDIIIMYHQFNGRHFVKETIRFDDKLITVETKENSINYYTNSKDIASNTSNFEKKVYLKNNIIHSKKVEIEINQNMNRSSITKKYEAYIYLMENMPLKLYI